MCSTGQGSFSVKVKKQFEQLFLGIMIKTANLLLDDDKERPLVTRLTFLFSLFMLTSGYLFYYSFYGCPVALKPVVQDEEDTFILKIFAWKTKKEQKVDTVERKWSETLCDWWNGIRDAGEEVPEIEDVAVVATVETDRNNNSIKQLFKNMFSLDNQRQEESSNEAGEIAKSGINTEEKEASILSMIFSFKNEESEQIQEILTLDNESNTTEIIEEPDESGFFTSFFASAEIISSEVPFDPQMTMDEILSEVETATENKPTEDTEILAENNETQNVGKITCGCECKPENEDSD